MAALDLPLWPPALPYFESLALASLPTSAPCELSRMTTCMTLSQMPPTATHFMFVNWERKSAMCTQMSAEGSLEKQMTGHKPPAWTVWRASVKYGA